MLLCPASLRPYAFYLSPVVGYCFATLMGWYCFRLGLQGTDSYAVFLLVPPAILSVIALTFRKRWAPSMRATLDDDWLKVSAVALSAFLLLSIPFFRHGLISLSVANNDIADVATVARFLKEPAIESSQGFLGQTRVIEEMAKAWIFGGPFAVAWFGSLSSKPPYQMQSASLVVFAVLAIPLVYAIAREWFQYGKRSGRTVALFYGFHAMMVYLVHRGFQGQIFAMTLVLALYLIHCKLFPKIDFSRETAGFFALAVLLNWGLSITYGHMFFLAHAPFTLFAILASIYARDSERAVRWLVFTLLALLATFALSPFRAFTLFLTTASTAIARTGWFVPLIFPDVVLGIVADRSDLENTHIAVHLALAVLLFSLLLWGLVRTYRSRPQRFLATSACLISVYTGYFLLAFLWRTDSGWGGYKSFKFLSFFLPLIVCSWMLWIPQFEGPARLTENRIRSMALLIFALAVIGSGVTSSLKTARKCNTVTTDLAALAVIETLPQVESINLRFKDPWDTLWGVYFLMRKRLYFEYSTYAGREASPLIGQWDLWNKLDLPYGMSQLDAVDVAFENGTYVLLRAPTPKPSL